MLTTFDLRFTRPNEEPPMDNPGIHSIEHLVATFLRNHREWADKTVYFGPMGCRTGFYFLVRDMAPETAIRLVRETMAFTADYQGPIPGATEAECGNYREQDLEGARAAARKMLPILKDWTVEKLAY